MRTRNTINDLSASQLSDILDAAIRMQHHVERHRVLPQYLRGFCLGMIFDETSLRTRSAFERAMYDLGGHAIHYSGADVRVGRHAKKQEHLPDLVNVAGRFNDALLSRIYDHQVQVKIAALSPVPFINGMCDMHHPTQAICDLLTIKRRFGTLVGVKIAFVGDGTNIARSLAQACSLLNVEFAIATPESMRLGATAQEMCRTSCETTDPIRAVRDAHAVIGDVWFPMNGSHEAVERYSALEPFRITMDLMRHARSDAVFMHNLPAYREQEVTTAVIDGPRSVIYEEAVARLHIARAILLFALRPDAERLLEDLEE